MIHIISRLAIFAGRNILSGTLFAAGDAIYKWVRSKVKK